MEIGPHIQMLHRRDDGGVMTNDHHGSGGIIAASVSFDPDDDDDDTVPTPHRPLTTSGSSTGPISTNEHNLAMMQDIVIEQILSGDLHGNSFHRSSIAVVNAAAAASATIHDPMNRSLGNNSSNHSSNFLHNGSSSSSGLASKLNRFSKIPFVSKFMQSTSAATTTTTASTASSSSYFGGKPITPYRDNPIDEESSNHSSSYRHYSTTHGGNKFPTRTSIAEYDTATDVINLHEDHDQLPDVDTYKVSHHRSTYPTNNYYWHGISRNRLRNCLTITAGVCICIFFTLLGVFIGRDGGGSPSSSNSMSVETTPSSSTNGSNHSSKLTPAERLDALIELIKEQKWSKGELLLKKDSAQTAAAYWVANKDPLQVDIDVDNIQLQQRYALAVLYYATKGTNWNTNFYFLSDKSECEWYQYWAIHPTSTTGKVNRTEINRKSNYTSKYTESTSATTSQVGVICDDYTLTNDTDIPVNKQKGIVTRLYIPSNNVQGELPAELALLTNLIELNFYNNEITGIIHGTFKSLTKLEAFVLYQNQIRDVIPTWLATSMGHTLQVFNWGKNDIYGMIPTNFNQLTKLTTFNCESCNIQGPITPLKGMESLEAIHLGSNSLKGQFTEDLFDSWKNLIELDFGDNQLTGTIPRGLLDNDHLLVIDLHANKFTGNIYDINPGSNVRVLALHNNQLTGRVDTIIRSLSTKIQHLDLSNNLFVGSGIPRSIGRLTDLRYLFLANNPFDREPIPTEIGTLTNLIDVSFQKTKRTGSIPYQIKDLKDLVLLDLNDNDLTGQIPDEIGSLSNLHFLLLRNNDLSGSIPESFYQLSSLDTMLLNSNRAITGSTNAVCRPALPSLRIFRMECAKLDGTSPSQQCPCCTACCENDKTGLCAVDEFFANIDPTSEYNYVRKFYHFNEEDVVFPVNQLPDNETPLYSTDADNKEGDTDDEGGDSDSPVGDTAIPYEYGKFTNPQTSGNVQGIPVNNTNNDVSPFEEYYEDENGEDTPDNNVIDVQNNVDSPKYQFENPINPYQQQGQQQNPPTHSDNTNDNTNYGSKYDSNYGQISP